MDHIEASYYAEHLLYLDRLLQETAVKDELVAIIQKRLRPQQQGNMDEGAPTPDVQEHVHALLRRPREVYVECPHRAQRYQAIRRTLWLPTRSSSPLMPSTLPSPALASHAPRVY